MFTWLWRSVSEPSTICRGAIAFLPLEGDYVCVVSVLGETLSYQKPTAYAATNAARDYVERRCGEVRVKAELSQLRIRYQDGLGYLVDGTSCIRVDDDWVRHVADRNAIEVRGFFHRTVAPTLSEGSSERRTLEDWLVVTERWNTVPVDAAFMTALFKSKSNTDYEPQHRRRLPT